jgi:hypothetical protein
VRLGPPLELHLESTRCRPGETVTGTVRLPEGGEVRELRVALRFYERTEDYEDEQDAGETVVHAGSALPDQSFPFTLQLPADALPTLSSTHGELGWKLEARADVRGFDARESRTLAVLPAD